MKDITKYVISIEADTLTKEHRSQLTDFLSKLLAEGVKLTTDNKYEPNTSVIKRHDALAIKIGNQVSIPEPAAQVVARFWNDLREVDEWDAHITFTDEEAVKFASRLVEVRNEAIKNKSFSQPVPTPSEMMRQVTRETVLPKIPLVFHPTVGQLVDRICATV